MGSEGSRCGWDCWRISMRMLIDSRWPSRAAAVRVLTDCSHSAISSRRAPVRRRRGPVPCEAESGRGLGQSRIRSLCRPGRFGRTPVRLDDTRLHAPARSPDGGRGCTPESRPPLPGSHRRRAAMVRRESPDTSEAAARNFAAFPSSRMFVGHFHRWLAVTPKGPMNWRGERPIRFESDNRYLVVIAAVRDGWVRDLRYGIRPAHPLRPSCGRSLLSRP